MLKILFLEGTQFIMKTLDSSLKIGKVFKSQNSKKSLKITVLYFFLRFCSSEGTVLKLFSATDPYTLAYVVFFPPIEF